MKIYGLKSSSFHANWPSFNGKKSIVIVSTLTEKSQPYLVIETLSYASPL